MLSFVLFLVIRVQDPKVVSLLKSNPAARRQLQAVAQRLIPESKSTGKTVWMPADPDFPAEIKKLGLKKCEVFQWVPNVSALKVPVNSKYTIVVFLRSPYEKEAVGPSDPQWRHLGNGVDVIRNLEKIRIISVKAGQEIDAALAKP